MKPKPIRFEARWRVEQRHVKVIQPFFETREVIFESAEAEMRQSLPGTFDNRAPAVTVAMRVNVDSVAASL